MCKGRIELQRLDEAMTAAARGARFGLSDPGN